MNNKYTNGQANADFVNNTYGNFANYKAAVKDDYCKAQLIWTCYMDNLCADGKITQHQCNNIMMPKKKTKLMN